MRAQETTRIMRPRNVQPLRSVSDVIRSIVAAECDRVASRARVARIDQETDAGFACAPYDGVTCKTCGCPTSDDGDRYCDACMPICTECEQSTNSPNHDGICDDCVDAAWERRSARIPVWNGNSRSAP